VYNRTIRLFVTAKRECDFMENVMFFALDKNFDLAQKIAKKFKKDMIVPDIVTFADSEIRLDLPEGLSVEGTHALIIHSTVDPVNVSYMELFFLIDLLKRKGAKKITVVTPYFGYARQCGCKKGEDVGHAKIVAHLIECSGAGAVCVVEVHDDTLQSFFSIDFTNLLLRTFIADHIKKTFSNLQDFCLVATDKGTCQRVKEIAGLLRVDSFFFCKKRSGINNIEITGMSDGNIAGKQAIIIDDIIDTGSTALKVVEKLSQLGVKNMYAYFVHSVLSGDAAQKLEKSPIEKIFVTNTVSLQDDKKIEKIEVLDISEVLSEALQKK